MAKSLRSKSKRAFRRIKRDDPKSDFHLKEKIRLARLSDKLKVLTAVENSDDEEFEDAGNENGAGIDEDQPVNDATTTETTVASQAASQGDLQSDISLDNPSFYLFLGLLDADSLTFAMTSKEDSEFDSSAAQLAPVDLLQHEAVSSGEPIAAPDVEMDGQSTSVGTGGPRLNANNAWRKRNGVVATKKRTEKNSTTFSAKRRSFKSTGKAKGKGKR